MKKAFLIREGRGERCAARGVVGHTGPWTIAAVERLPDMGDHSRYEILSPGVLTVSPAPATAHQRASRILANLLEAAADEADVEVLEAVNVELPGERLATPDIVVVDADFAATNPFRYPPSAVLLAVEIVSPGSRATDRAIKPGLYAEAEIPTYWRVELEPTPTLIVSALSHGKYVERATMRAGGKGMPEVPFPIELDPTVLGGHNR